MSIFAPLRGKSNSETPESTSTQQLAQHLENTYELSPKVAEKCVKTMRLTGEKAMRIIDWLTPANNNAPTLEEEDESFPKAA